MSAYALDHFSGGPAEGPCISNIWILVVPELSSYMFMIWFACIECVIMQILTVNWQYL
jgi:hypothetical protein